ncbi:MAG: bifunctional shikimate kinase/3-dehydroquinate synthase [Actinobacteria bacterium]|nr:MAG: bifunctional shikimate kinase/3-dehydroquinate synthase [Actinomycetota bacterium]
MSANALERHLALIGFMGAGKSTLGPEVARRLGREFFDVDQEIERAEGPIADIFDERGELSFRDLEAAFVAKACNRRQPAVIALGGGAVEGRELLQEFDVFAVHLAVDVDTAWERVQGSRRPLAREESEFRRRYDERRPLYEEVADARASDLEDIVLAAAGVRVALGALELLGGLVPGDGPVALVTDPHVGGIHGAAAQLALGDRLRSTHEVPAGEEAKTAAVVERLWRELRLDRTGTLIALGGGCVTDVAGFAAATYLRGIPWVAVPTTLVGQVDAAIGGKTAIDLPEGKNLVGAFNWPARTVIDPALLETLPERERREGLAEVVKTGLLAGEALWELPQQELVRRCAAFKAAVCLRDPYDRGERHILNLGHTFAHALEAAAAYEDVTHGTAVALGLRAVLRLSGRSAHVVDHLLAPKPVRVDRERAWAALQRDKKRGLVLLGDDGPRWDVQLPDDEVRRALDTLIAD